MRNDDRFINSPGTRYFPEAFEPEPYKLGKPIANDSNFHRALLQYILLVMATPIQLVHFRAAIIKEVIRSAGDDRSALNKRELPIPKVTWCALSLASDRYFDETARGYGWPEADMELIRSQWYDIIAPAFVPTDTNRRLDIAVILQFAVEVEKLHHRDIGPFPACDLCQAKCRYNYQVEQLIQDAKLQSDFQACVPGKIPQPLNQWHGFAGY